MKGRVCNVRLINNTWWAVIAVFLTGWFATRSFRGLFFGLPHKFHWFVPVDYVLPHWAAIAVNLMFYASVLWQLIGVGRIIVTKERLLFVGFFTVMLQPLEGLLSPPAAVAIEFVAAIGTLSAFLAAIFILIETSTSRDAQV